MDGNLESNCYGTVHIKRNDSNYPVCASNWSEKEGNVVCKELKCGKVSFQRQLSVALLHICFI